MSDAKIAKGTTLKNWIIVFLVIIIIVLLWSNTLDPDTKEKFYWFLGGLAIIIAIVYLLARRKRMDIWKIGDTIRELEFKNTGYLVPKSDLQADVLDADTLVMSFESHGKVVTYKWNTVESYVIARLVKKIEEVKNETDNREVHRTMALRSIDKQTARRVAEEHGFELKDDNDTNEE